MIDQWGTEVALAIALTTGSFVLWVGKDEFKKTKTGRKFIYLLVMMLTLTVLIYLGLRLNGVNP